MIICLAVCEVDCFAFLRFCYNLLICNNIFHVLHVPSICLNCDESSDVHETSRHDLHGHHMKSPLISCMNRGAHCCVFELNDFKISSASVATSRGVLHCDKSCAVPS